MRFLALLPLAASLLPQAARAAGEAERSGGWRFAARAEVEARYDDNIIGLSEAEKDQVDAGSTLFGVESPDDVVLAPGLRFSLERSPRRGRETEFALTLKAHDYQRSSAKDYQEYGVSVRQDLSRSRRHGTSIRLRLTRLPDYFVRRLRDEDASQAAGTTVRNAASYRKNAAAISVTQEIVPRRLEATAGYSHERRNYNDDFDERDSTSRIFFLEVDIRPLRGAAFSLQPSYRRERRDSRGDLASSVTLVDDDVGFDADLLGLHARWRWGADADHRNVFGLWCESERRDFTTVDDVDTGHFAREDRIAQAGIDYDREFGPRWRLLTSYRHRRNDVTLPDPLGGDRTTRFSKNVFSAGVAARW